MRPLRLAGILVTSIALATAASAEAGTYRVFACGDGPVVTNHSWTVSNSDPIKLETGDACGAAGSYAGLYARDVLDVSNARSTSTAQWTFTAPAGTSINALSYNRWLFKEDDEDWQPALIADATLVDTCRISYGATNCSSGSEGG